MSLDRRDVLKLAAGVSALADGPRALAKALAVAPNAASGTLNDVEHVVILMQENRSFDHYFGSLRGVRGFGDPRPVTLPSGQPVWAQPDPKTPGAHIAPFRLNGETTSAQVMHSLDHSWKGSHVTWQHHDAWIDKKTPLTMGYFTRADIPFYYALADAFTVCDAYHASIFASTNPNRMYLFSGTNGIGHEEIGSLAVSNPITETNETADPAADGKHFAGFGWTTYAERLHKAGVSWKVYQEHDNYGDNGLAYFKAFRGTEADPALMAKGRGCAAGSTAENAKTSRGEHLVAELAKDAREGTLPQVSWIVAPYIMCEHPSASPGYGESLTARLIEAIADQPEVWAKTVFILNYDENDGFFDHVPPPIPALTPAQGATTVASDGENYKGEPVGLGPRVPMIVISPWTRGGWVNSQVFDHTSVIRFLEARFGVQEPNITPWRRSVCGDLTSCFDFKAARIRGGADGGKAHLPDTAQAMAKVDAASKLSRPAVPAAQNIPKQEPGVRLARALPYRFEATGTLSDGALALSLVNSGPTGMVFSAWPKGGDPRFYTVGAGKTLQATLPLGAGAYDVALHGPNGWRRVFTGGGSEALEVHTSSDPASGKLTLLIRNDGLAREVIVTPGLYPHGPARRHTLKHGETLRDAWNVAASHHWYDLIVTAPSHRDFQRRVSGHVETGRPSLSDPALGV